MFLSQMGLAYGQMHSIVSPPSSAEVVVHLRNRGAEAYKPAAYGKTIVIQRQINSDGTGSYKLKSVGGDGSQIPHTAIDASPLYLSSHTHTHTHTHTHR